MCHLCYCFLHTWWRCRPPRTDHGPDIQEPVQMDPLTGIILDEPKSAPVCSEPAPPASPAPLSSADFEPLSILGQGAMGTVLLTRARLCGKAELLALKVMSKCAILHAEQEVHVMDELRVMTRVSVQPPPRLSHAGLTYACGTCFATAERTPEGAAEFHHAASLRFPEPHNAFPCAAISARR